MLRSLLVAVALVTPAIAGPAQAAGTVPAAVSLAAPSSATYGTAITLSGRVWRYGTPTGLGGAVVWLQRAPHGRATWANVTNTRTASNGNYAFTVSHVGAYDYRVYYGGSATYRAGLSPVRYPVVNQRLTLDYVVTTDADTGKLLAGGRVQPTPPDGTLVYLQRWSTDGRVWVNLGSARTSAGGYLAVPVTRPGSVASYRLVVPARSPYGVGVSATKAFAHHVWRGAFLRPITAINGHAAYRLLDSPRHEKITVQQTGNSSFMFELDITGCNSIATTTVAHASNLAAVDLQLRTVWRLLAGASVAPGAQSRMSAELASTDQEVRVHAQNLNSSSLATLDHSILLRCAN